MDFIGHHLCPNFPTVSSNVSGASSYDGTIIIIGAGVAGLSAACSLKKMGIDCVVLNCPVTKVEYNMNDNNGDNTEVTLTLKDGTIRIANRLICTASLAVLKTNIIEFVPPLPQEIQNALQSIKMPPGVYKDVNYCGTMLDLAKNGDDLALIYDPLLGKKGLDNQQCLCCNW